MGFARLPLLKMVAHRPIEKNGWTEKESYSRNKTLAATAESGDRKLKIWGATGMLKKQKPIS